MLILWQIFIYLFLLPLIFVCLANEFGLRLRLFRRKIFSVVKCFQMQMIFRKMFVFPVFVCILENASENILRCLVRRKMKFFFKKKT